MKSKAKAQPRKKPVARSKKKTVPAKKVAAKRTQVSAGKQEFAKFVWPSIKDTTKFVEVPESQGTVSYVRPLGDQVTVTLKWYTVSHGPRILGHYDDENNVCYIGRFIEG